MKTNPTTCLLPIVAAGAMFAIADSAQAAPDSSSRPAFCLSVRPASVAAATVTEYVVNGDFSAGNTGFTTGYMYAASGQSTTPGTYGVRTSSQDFNPGYTEFHDHTTGTGMMMLVDGSPAGASATVWSETVTVPANTRFNFSAWATSSSPTNPPPLRFSINGVEIGSDFDLTTTVQFQNFTASWNSGSATSALITIVDTSTIGSQANGNDFGLDDISLTNSVPEPSTWVVLLLGGAAGLRITLRRQPLYAHVS